MSSNHGLDVLLLCQDEELQPWQKAIFIKHEEAQRKHEAAMISYKQEMKQFYAGMGVTYNKKNGEASPMEQQVSESQSGVTRLVTTLPVTQSPLVNPQPSKTTNTSSVKPLNKIIMPRSLPTSRFAPSTQPYKPSFAVSKPGQVITAVRPLPPPTIPRQPERPAMNLPVKTMAPPLPKPVTTLAVTNVVRPSPPVQSSKQPPAKRPLSEAISPSQKRQAVEGGSKSDKYYGFKKGKVMRNEDGDRKFRIKCFHCDSVLPNNILYMEHIQNYLETSRQDMKDSHLFCTYCFKRMKSVQDLENHFDRFHSTVNKYYCKFCDYSFKSKSMLKSHLQGVHDPLSMPYVCKVCQYRTSVFMDMRSHFTAVHKGAKALQCPHCFKVLRCSRSYLQHCGRHYAILMKSPGNFRCPCCKLQFLSSTERNEHVQNDHKKLKVHEKDGLPQYRPQIFTKPSTKPLKPVSKKGKSGNASTVVPTVQKAPPPKTPALLECLECGGAYSNLQNHLSLLMRCSSCSYVTFCGAAFAQHTIVFHSSFKAPPKIHPVKKIRLDDGQLSLTCRKCGFSTLISSTMAWHTVSCSKGSSSTEAFVYLKLKQKKLFQMEDDGSSEKEVIEILSDGE